MVINQSEDPLTIAENTVLGLWEPIEDGDLCKVTSTNLPVDTEENVASIENKDTPLPERLQELYYRASEGLNERQRQMLHEVLWEHQEAFDSTSKCLVEHEIDMG